MRKVSKQNEFVIVSSKPRNQAKPTIKVKRKTEPTINIKSEEQRNSKKKKRKKPSQESYAFALHIKLK